MGRKDANLFQWSLTLGLWSNVADSALTQSWSPLVNMSPGIQQLATVFLLILPAGIGIVLGVMSLKRKELKPGWAITAIVLNIIGMLLGIVLLSFP
jgi:uncharacterized membrane protein HdeD (DUF308 family)